MNSIHHTAVVDPKATIGPRVTIGPFCVVGPHVVLKEDVVLKSHVVLDGNTTVGARTTIYSGAVIGSKTQDKKYRGETTYVEIGQDCEIREFVTINSSCGEGSVVRVGHGCLIMAYCHVAHNCELEDLVIMANNATLAGHVTVGKGAVIGGLSAAHQYVRIGAYAMVGGMSRVTHDVPPYTIGAGSPWRFGGLNLVGLKRHGFPLATRIALSRAFKLVYRSGLELQQALQEIEQSVDNIPEIAHWLQFCKTSKRGLIGLKDEQEGALEETKVPPVAANCGA